MMKSDKEIVGTLLGFDDFVSILLTRGDGRVFLQYLRTEEL